VISTVRRHHNNTDVRRVGRHLAGNGFQTEETCWR